MGYAPEKQLNRIYAAAVEIYCARASEGSYSLRDAAQTALDLFDACDAVFADRQKQQLDEFAEKVTENRRQIPKE